MLQAKKGTALVLVRVGRGEGWKYVWTYCTQLRLQQVLPKEHSTNLARAGQVQMGSFARPDTSLDQSFNPASTEYRYRLAMYVKHCR